MRILAVVILMAFLVFPAYAFEKDEITSIRWFCDDLESIERLHQVAITKGSTATVAAIINETGRGDNATCHMFYAPIPVRLMEKQFEFYDNDPAYLVEVWSVNNGSMNGYSFLGTELGPGA